MGLLRDRVRDSKSGVILYELIPPARGTDEVTLRAYAECVAEVVASTSVPIDAVNLPEIRDEQRAQEQERAHPYEPKADPRQFGRHLKEAAEMEIVVNHGTVYEPWPRQQAWLQQTWAEHGIQNLVLVGGESSLIRYPGPSVTEMAEHIRAHYDHVFFLGGIVIPSRRRRDPSRDEPQRLLHKSRCGLEFFTSQVLYEAQSTQSLLRDYQRLCEQTYQTPKRIFLSFAPVSSRKDLAFLRWLGVEIPQEVEERLLRAEIGIGWRSLQIAQQVLSEILEFCDAEGVDVPLGLNIEHITRHNFELSREFIDHLGAIYYERLRRRSR